MRAAAPSSPTPSTPSRCFTARALRAARKSPCRGRGALARRGDRTDGGERCRRRAPRGRRGRGPRAARAGAAAPGARGRRVRRERRAVNAADLTRVLVAEDDPAMGELLREYLEHHGFAVTI